jgi:hypothetical protein
MGKKRLHIGRQLILWIVALQLLNLSVGSAFPGDNGYDYSYTYNKTYDPTETCRNPWSWMSSGVPISNGLPRHLPLPLPKKYADLLKAWPFRPVLCSTVLHPACHMSSGLTPD